MPQYTDCLEASLMDANVEREKKAYEKPALQVYGDLVEITGTVAYRNAVDGGRGRTTHTS